MNDSLDTGNGRILRGVAVSDLHCGHRVGLTPPAWQRPEWFDVQQALWNFYQTEAKALGKLDFLIVNGDVIDGKGKRSGATELIETDLERQAEMGTDCLKVFDVEGSHIFMAYGTPYHVATDCGTDMENQIAREFGGNITGHGWLDVNGVVFDYKHKVGSSTVPHGRSTAVKKEALWNALWHERGMNPKGDIILRSHVHYHDYTGNVDYLAMTTPALQGPGSKFGTRQCSGVVDFGFISFEIGPPRAENGKGQIAWKQHILKAIAPEVAHKL